MIDLVFIGQRFTWSNKYENKSTIIMERLDRFLGNLAWV